MNQNVIIAVALVGVVGLGLYLSRRAQTSTDGAVKAFSNATTGASFADAFAPDAADQPSTADTGISAGTSSMITPDSGRALGDRAELRTSRR